MYNKVYAASDRNKTAIKNAASVEAAFDIKRSLLNFVESLSCCICCMQELVCLVAVGLAEELAVEFLDLGIVV